MQRPHAPENVGFLFGRGFGDPEHLGTRLERSLISEKGLGEVKTVGNSVLGPHGGMVKREDAYRTARRSSGSVGLESKRQRTRVDGLAAGQVLELFRRRWPTQDGVAMRLTTEAGDDLPVAARLRGRVLQDPA